MNKIIDYKTVFHLMENTYLNAELLRKKGFLVVTCQDTTTFRIILHWIVASVSHALSGFSFIEVLRQYLTYL